VLAPFFFRGCQSFSEPVLSTLLNNQINFKERVFDGANINIEFLNARVFNKKNYFVFFDELVFNRDK